MKRNILHIIEGSVLFSFFTGSLFSQVPILTTAEVININPNSAQSGGNITSDGGNPVVVSGVCWSTSPNPTTLNDDVFGYTAIGSFTSLMAGLLPNTTYYVRAFARNSAGTGYGNELTFTTLPITPIVFNPGLTYGSITDIDGNSYQTIQIGTQLWMAENLRVTQYSDGSGAITFIPSNSSIPWSDLDATQTPGYCFYNEGDQATYGALYNWYAVNTNRLCPDGWYVPTDGDWNILTNLYGGSIEAGASLKEAGFLHWPGSNTSNNSSGFTANPGGYRDHIGSYYGMTTEAFFWSTTIASPTTFRHNLHLEYENDNAFFSSVFSSQGSSVRCLHEYPPSIETYTPYSVTPTSAQSGGYFLSMGNLPVESAGICWSTSPNPTISDTYNLAETIYSNYFTCALTDLNPNTRYYFRPFATNSEGIGYGNELSFITPCNIIDLSIYNHNDVTCFGGNDGNILLAAPGYTYVWTGPDSFTSSSQNITNIRAGDYFVTVTDAYGCYASASFTITQPSVLSATVSATMVTCYGGNNGTISITAPSGGSGTYAYSINGGTTWQDNGMFTNLAPGTYAVSIRDAAYADCVVSLNGTLLITQPPLLSATETHTDVTCNGANDGTISIVAAGGYGTYEFSINGGVSWQTGGTYTGLGVGYYKVRIRDLAYPACMLIINDELGIYQPGVLSATAASTNVTCNGANDGIINITNPSGGSGAYEYTINGGTSWQTTSSYPGLTPGSYNVQIRDAAHTNCVMIVHASLSITQPALLSATETVITQSCNNCSDAAINLAVSGGVMPYSFAWTGPEGYNSSSQNIASLKPGSYSVVFKDANNCSQTVYANVINPFVVTNVNDDGIGSLRYAINYANGHNTATLNQITFDIPFGLPSTIQPASALPDITRPLIIDGYSAPGASIPDLILRIELEGTNAGSGSNGLTIKSSNCIIKGLIIDGFSGNGIQVYNGTGNTLSANSISNNDKLGIDLGTNSLVTLNDQGDGDTGPNNLQNFPVLTSVSFSPGFVTVSGSLNSIRSATSYKLEFFANKVADNNGFGEGQTYLGSGTVTISSASEATFSFTFPTLTRYGDVITATATDPTGNTSEFSSAVGGLQNQILPSTSIPFHYKINGESVRNIDNTTICNQIKSSFGNWSGIGTSVMSFQCDGTTVSKYASSSDHLNLVSFKDDQFPFSPGVLAVTAKTLKLGTTDTEAQIIDADIVFNPYYVNNPTYNLGITDNSLYTGYFDIQSITTHEIGHIMGLLHSGVYNATMWFEIGQGIESRSLEQDDKSWLSYRYPDKAKYDKAFGSISGNIKYGYNNDPVAGAIVLAVDPVSDLAVVHAFSDVNGNYLIPGLPPGSYRVYIMPLDGDVYGRNLKPGNISPYIYSNTIYTDYPGEFYNYPDLAIETNPAPTPVNVSVGNNTGGINLITNKDVTSPTVRSVVPASGSTNVSVLPDILITFSEPVDIGTLTGQTCYLTKSGSSIMIGGIYQSAGFEDNSDIVLFTLPENALDYGSDYTLHITTGVADLKTNHLAQVYTSTFHTQIQDQEPPKIKSTIPEDGSNNVFITEKIRIFFSEPMIKSSVEGSFVLTTDNGTTRVDCSPIWDEYSSLLLSPKSPLIEAKTYTLNWTNLATDLSGNHLTPGAISFTTISLAAPTVIYLEPGGSPLIYDLEPGDAYLTTGVDVKTPVVVDFSEPINTATVDLTTFKLLVGTTTQQVSGTFTFLNDNSRVVFQPSADLNFNQLYSINLTSNITDVSKVVQSFAGLTTKFTTAAKPLKPHIEYINPTTGGITSQIKIGGYGFDPDPLKNKVTFTAITTAGVDAYPVKASLTSLLINIPYGAVSGAVRVTSNGVLDDQDPNNLSTYLYIIKNLDPCNSVYSNTGVGAKPRDGALDFNGANAYITNFGENTVSVITNLDNSDPTHDGPYELTRIQVGTSPIKIAINPTGTRAYVTNFDSHNVSVIDLTDANGTKNEVIETISVGINPYGIVANGDKVYVANYGSKDISIINVDPSNGGFDHIIANINTGTNNRDIDITPDGGILVVTGENGLTVVKLVKTALGYDYLVTNSNQGASTRSASITTDNAFAIVTTMSGSIFFVDISPGDNFGAAYGNYNPSSKAGDGKTSYDGLFYYVTNPDDDKVTVYKITYEGNGSGSGTISSSSGISLKEYTSFPVGDSPEGIAIDPGDDRLIVANSGSNTVTSVYICCPDEKTATDLVKDLIFPIEEMIWAKEIQRSLGVMLIGKLNDASINILRGKTKTAINSLKAFIDKVNELKAAGKFPQNQPYIADDLIAIAKRIINMLLNPVAAKSPPEEPIIYDADLPHPDLIAESGLGTIYPNPFSESVTINYDIADNSESINRLLMRIYDINGRLVSTLINQPVQSGHYSIVWNGRSENGDRAPYGTYFVLFSTGDVEEVKTIMLIR